MSDTSSESVPDARPANFIEQKIKADISSGKHGGRVHTRFPPEPNGYLHIGHAKAICVSFGLAKQFGGKTNLRFDDTNPEKESLEYVNAIKKDISWLGFDWDGDEFYTSDYFEQLYNYACKLISKGLAYVDDQTAEQIAAQKGAPGTPGVNSAYRTRSAEENQKLFGEMKAGRCKEGERVLRAKIDMGHVNMLMRDPVIYRVKFVNHHRTGEDWVIYPMYDFAHGQSDSIERITHSLCSLEFENHRPLYNWFIRALDIYPSEQTEFARLNLNYTIMSKRKLLRLVEEGVVDDWDDPRMPTISGLRRRGYTAESIRVFSNLIGVAKRNNTIDVSLLEWSLRDDLNRRALRVMAVLNPIRLVVLNYPEEKMEMMKAVNNPEDEAAGTREIPFGRELWMEADDFRVDVNKKWFRLAPGRTVRLKFAYIVQYVNHLQDEQGNVTEVHVNYLPNSRSGQDTSGVKPKGTLHWVAADSAKEAEVRLYDRLFKEAAPEAKGDFMDALNPNSLKILQGCKVEPCLSKAAEGTYFQFTRLGYFTLDPKHSKPGLPVFNRSVSLKDGWKG